MSGVTMRAPVHRRSRAGTPARVADVRFAGVCMLLFVASAWITVVWSSSMSAMDEMPMPGGWTMSMTWMRMPGRSWLDAGASFLGMWSVMMMAMMLPSLAPMLWRFRRAVGASAGRRVETLTALVGASYLLTWSLVGAIAYPLGIAVAELAMAHPPLSRVAPFAVGATVLAAGMLQFTTWKARHLACCRGCSLGAPTLSAKPTSALRHGAMLARHCLACCAGPMAALLAVGVMDLRAMALVTLAITTERVAPAGKRWAKAWGIVGTLIGLYLVVEAMASG